jgi:hypothetical protein
METIPLHSADLIADLDKLIPEQCPSVGMTDRDIWVYSGKRQLINMLLATQRELEDNILEP